MTDLNRRLTVGREPYGHERRMRYQRQPKRDCYVPGPHLRSVRPLDDSARHIDARGEADHRREHGHSAGTPRACDPEPEKRDVPGHEGREDLTQGEEADGVDG